MIVSLLIFVGLPIIFAAVLLRAVFLLLKSFSVFLGRFVMLALLVLFAGLVWRFADATSLSELPELEEAWGQLGSQVLPPLIQGLIVFLEFIF